MLIDFLLCTTLQYNYTEMFIINTSRVILWLPGIEMTAKGLTWKTALADNARYVCMSFIAKIGYICTNLILNFHVQSHWFLDCLSAEILYATYKYLADQITVCCQEPVSLIQTVCWWGKVWGSSACPGNCPEFCSIHVWILISWSFISVIFCFIIS